MVFSGSPQVYTHRWAEARSLPSFWVPVRISIGTPRYWPETRDMPAIHELMPYEILGRAHGAREFERRYRARLDGFGAERVQRRFDRLIDRYDGRPLVLCCYEDLHRLGEFCHRSMFRRWWEDMTGAAIEDLQFTDPDGPHIEPAAEPDLQQALFAA